MALPSESSIDDTSWRLLRALQEDARRSFSELGRRVGLSPPAVAERVRRMEEMGIIRHYRVTLDITRLGYPITAFVRLAPRPDSRDRIPQVALGLSEVVECHNLVGEDGYLMKIIAGSLRHLEALVDTLARHGETQTSLVLSTPVPGKMILASPSLREHP